jgi:hypothetical protein
MRIFGDSTMADASKPGDEVATHTPQPVTNPMTPAPPHNGMPKGGWGEKLARLKGRLLPSADAYVNYYIWLISFGCLGVTFGLLAYGFHNEHFWFHICLELSVGMLMLLVTVVLVERMLEYRREMEHKQRWSLVREDTLTFYKLILVKIVIASAVDLLAKPQLLADSSDSYKAVANELRTQCGILEQTNDAQAMKAWAQKIIEWHVTLTPVFNMLRTVVVPPILYNSRNRTLVRCVLVTQALIGSSEISLMELRRDPSISPSSLGEIARIVESCEAAKDYFEQAELHGVNDLDDWGKY